MISQKLLIGAKMTFIHFAQCGVIKCHYTDLDLHNVAIDKSPKSQTRGHTFRHVLIIGSLCTCVDRP